MAFSFGTWPIGLDDVSNYAQLTPVVAPNTSWTPPLNTCMPPPVLTVASGWAVFAPPVPSATDLLEELRVSHPHLFDEHGQPVAARPATLVVPVEVAPERTERAIRLRD